MIVIRPLSFKETKKNKERSEASVDPPAGGSGMEESAA